MTNAGRLHSIIGETKYNFSCAQQSLITKFHFFSLPSPDFSGGKEEGMALLCVVFGRWASPAANYDPTTATEHQRRANQKWKIDPSILQGSSRETRDTPDVTSIAALYCYPAKMQINIALLYFQSNIAAAGWRYFICWAGCGATTTTTTTLYWVGGANANSWKSRLDSGPIIFGIATTARKIARHVVRC